MPIYVPSRTALEDRTLIRSRQMFVSKQTRCKNQIKALLSFYGITVPEDIVDRYWSARYVAWLEGLSLQSPSGTEAYAVNVLYLTTISGISTLVAMILLTEIITLDRFRSLDHLSCFVGLVPGERSSGDERTMTGITERKNRYLR